MRYRISNYFTKALITGLILFSCGNLLAHAKKALPFNELHTHYRAILKADDILEMVLDDGTVTYPAALLRKLKVPLPNDSSEVLINRKNFSPESLAKIKASMELPVGKVANFGDLERIYEFRAPFLRYSQAHRDLYLRLLQKVGFEFQSQGVGYAEMSAPAEILEPGWLEAVQPVLSEIEKTTKVKLRFLLGIRRTLAVPEMLKLIDRVKLSVTTNNPYLRGVDFMGEELNSTASFSEAISAAAKINRSVPNFQVRVHAGENPLFPNNVKEAIVSGATRIGHGVHGIDEDSLRLAREHNVTVELNPTSNEGLGNIESLNEIPIKRYQKAGVNTVASTDGGGIFETNVRDEILRLKRDTGINTASSRRIQNLVFIPGSFDPPTRAHLEMFLTGFQKYHADKEVIMLSTLNGSRDHYASFEQRRDMIRSMIPPEYSKKVTIIKEEVGGATEALQQIIKNPKDLVIAIVGEDAFKENLVLPKNLTYKVTIRPSNSKPLQENDKIERITLPETGEISSTQVRQALQSKDEVKMKNGLTPEVEHYIQEHKLYTPPTPSSQKALKIQYQKRYKNFQTWLKREFKDMHFNLRQSMQFDPLISPAAWNEQFLRQLRLQPGYREVVERYSIAVDQLLQRNSGAGPLYKTREPLCDLLPKLIRKPAVLLEAQ